MEDTHALVETTRSKIASKGGLARASSLTSDERSIIASQAAKARWEGDLPVAEHDGELIIAGRRIACAVLNTRKRVLAQHTFLTALGRSARPKGGTGSRRLFDGAGGLPPFLSAANLEPFISNELRQSTTPIVYKKKSGGRAYGWDALLLPMVCEVYLKARDAHLDAIKRNPEHGILQHMQEDLVKACDMLMRGLAREGIISLVDQATGFHEQLARDDLSKILEAYIAPELMPWTRKFPAEFFKQVFKIHGWEYQSKSTKRPQCVGAFINDYVYKQLPEGVLEELRRLNPVSPSGYRRYKHTQFLTAETGNEHLDRQITAVTTIMRIADSKADFKQLFTKAYPKSLDEVRPPLVIEVKKPVDEPTLFPLLSDFSTSK